MACHREAKYCIRASQIIKFSQFANPTPTVASFPIPDSRFPIPDSLN
ncbi:hypothetical protein [Moorena sp. SIO3H5]|nr:hypothetical protein [Moorena sp. SIO3H5]NEO70653.1 hypothetical protein [Moorena sp. SIO3H5]